MENCTHQKLRAQVVIQLTTNTQTHTLIHTHKFTHTNVHRFTVWSLLRLHDISVYNRSPYIAILAFAVQILQNATISQ